MASVMKSSPTSELQIPYPNLSESLVSINNDSKVSSQRRKRRVVINIEPDIKKLKLNYDLPSVRGAQALMFGQGDVGQLGLGENILMRKKPAQIKSMEGVGLRQVAVGGMHTVLLTDNAECYSFGCNDEGALGRVTEEGEEYVSGKVSGLSDVKIVLISAGDSHSAYLTDTGKVYVSGTFRDNSGLFGLQDDVTKTKTPVLIYQSDSSPVIKICSGNDHLVLLTQKGEVLTLGNAEQGQLGRVAGSFSTRGGRRGRNYLLEPKPVHFPRERGFKLPIICDIYAGSYHTVAIASGPVLRVYAWGLNNYGQLGLGHFETTYIPTRMDMSGWSPDHITGSEIQFSGGQHHSVITVRGKVYVCGRGHFGTLGLGSGHKTELSTPTLIDSLSRICSVECGSSVCYAINEEGKAYAWGMGTCNQLTTGDDEDVFEPVLLTGKQLEDRRIISVSSGGQHSALLVKPVLPDKPVTQELVHQMNTEVARLAKQLEKLQKDDFEDPERALDLLHQLKECQISINLLNDTRVGLIVNTLRKKTSSPEVSALGKKLIKTWKKFLPAEEPKRPKTAYRNSPVYEQDDTLKNSPEPQPLPIVSSSNYQSVSRPHVSKREYHPVLTGNVIRDKIIEMIVDAFKKNVPAGKVIS
ncbi:Regulator of chromosome condensation isoform X3 [Oopsacas minuta]|uniref:Regulator of chromosome condensation isoform X3 n=1 Tax=Oopsacas minuta TaxID=111878 RepID=A0AAV7KIG0_9METZ|nr:Regulator of chromosome condensation isoform X3 [Oopsacas minuta]